MMEKVKNLLAGLASLTAFLYAAGYIAEYAHARMLGIPMAQPLNEYYLISGGTFVVSTLIALYTTIFKHFYFFIVVFIIAGAFLHYEANTPKKKVTKMSKTYIIILFISVLVFLFAAVPIFTSPFDFSGFHPYQLRHSA